MTVESTFIVDLPRMAEAVEAVSSESPEVLPQGHGCILFVDDEELLVCLGRERLEALGYEVVPSLSSVEALGLFQATPCTWPNEGLEKRNYVRNHKITSRNSFKIKGSKRKV